MRITNSMMVNNMISNISKNQSRMDKLQNQMATGKKIEVPSDDPVVAARALKLRTDVAEITQYQKNVSDGSSWLDITETALSNLGDVLKRANELAVQTSNGTMSAEDMKATLSEVTQLKGQIIELANSTYAGRYIFSGYKTDMPLMDSSGNYSIDVSNTEVINYEVGVGTDININVLGSDLFSTSGAASVVANSLPDTGVPTAAPTDMIAVMRNFECYLNNNDHASVSNLISNIQDQLNNVIRIRADVGARTNRLDLTANRLDTDNYNFTKLMSNNEDVDQAEVIMNLTNEQNVYKASLSAGARIIQPSLVDFLR